MDNATGVVWPTEARELLRAAKLAEGRGPSTEDWAVERLLQRWPEMTEREAIFLLSLVGWF